MSVHAVSHAAPPPVPKAQAAPKAPPAKTESPPAPTETRGQHVNKVA